MTTNYDPFANELDDSTAQAGNWTPEATQAMLARSAGLPAERFRPPVHVSLWS